MHTNVRLLKVKITAVDSYPLGRMYMTTIQHGSPFNNRTRHKFFFVRYVNTSYHTKTNRQESKENCLQVVPATLAMR